MAKEKQQPKGYKGKKILSNDAEMTLYGLMIFLVSLIGFLNSGIIGNFLTFVFVYLFGVFYFAFFLFAIFFGLYMVFKKKLFQIKINIRLLGVIFLLLASIIGASLAIENLTLTNVFSRFQNQLDFATIGSSFYRIDIAKVGYAGGGIIGFFLAALLNVTITNIGGLLLVAILFIVGLYLVFASPISKIIAFIKKRHQNSKKNKESAIEDIVDEEKETKNISDSSSPIASSVNNEESRTVSRVTLLTPFQTMTKPVEPVIANDIEEDEIEEEDEQNEVLTPIEEETMEIEDVKNITANVIKDDNKSYSKPVTNPFITKTIVDNTRSNNNNALPYKKPPLELLNDYPNEDNQEKNEEISLARQEIINRTFADFSTGATSVSFKIGPSVTRFDIAVKNDVSVKTVEKVIDDISVRLGGIFTRFTLVVPGKTTSGLEIPNKYISTVALRDVLKRIEDDKRRLLIPFGKDISGDVICESMIKFPHLLVAGASGTGKSVFIHSLITSILMRQSPDEVRFLLVDPKRVEFSLYSDMPHLLCPIVKDPLEAKVAFNKLIAEMENRYVLLENAQVNDIKRYNEEMELLGEKKLPYIVAVIDEYGDLTDACHDIENPLIRLAQKARAAGIHLVIATQRPSTKVVTGVLKANLPTKVALKVGLPVDSVTILGQGGAEELLGFGDSLVDCSSISRGELMRIQGPFIVDQEIKKVVAYLKENYALKYDDNFLDLKDRSAMGPSYLDGSNNDSDEAYDEVKEYVMNREYVSISRIQNTFRFGYNRASKIFSMLQNEGIVEKTLEGSTNSKGAKVLVRNVNTNSNDEEHHDD